MSLNAAIIVENSIVRQNIVNAIRKRYDNCTISDTGNANAADDILQNGNFDLIICCTHIGEVSFGETIRKIRQGHIGNNSFPVIMMLIADPIEFMVYRVLNCGPDDVLVMPISIQMIYDRLDYLERYRKPFVVANDYIGPDRRQEDRGLIGTKLVPAPNPLLIKTGRISASDTLAQIDQYNEDILSAKVLAYTNQILWISREIAKLHHGEFDLQSIIMHSTQVIEIIGSLNKISHKWDRSEVDQFIGELLGSINQILIQNGRMPVTRIEELRHYVDS